MLWGKEAVGAGFSGVESRGDTGPGGDLKSHSSAASLSADQQGQAPAAVAYTHHREPRTGVDRLGMSVALDLVGPASAQFAVKSTVECLARRVTGRLLRAVGRAPATSMAAALGLLARVSHRSSYRSSQTAAPEVAAWTARSIASAPPSLVALVVPQVVQALRSDTHGYSRKLLVSASSKTAITAHQVLWGLAAESEITAATGPDVDSEGGHGDAASAGPGHAGRGRKGDGSDAHGF